MTVKELKELIKDWSETDADGEDCEVWVMTGKNLSSQATEVGTLNRRERDGVIWSDLLIYSSAFPDE